MQTLRKGFFNYNHLPFIRFKKLIRVNIPELVSFFKIAIFSYAILSSKILSNLTPIFETLTMISYAIRIAITMT